MGLSSRFLEDAKEFVELSNVNGDGWELKGKSNSVSAAYLKKTIYEKLTVSLDPDVDELNSICKTDESCLNMYTEKQTHCIEFNIYFSTSYNVPVICFNIWNSSGKLLSLCEVWELCRTRFNLNDDNMYKVITQQEHPILFRPYFTVHPCKTQEIVDCLKGHCTNILVTILSTLGPLIGLNLDVSYGRITYADN